MNRVAALLVAAAAIGSAHVVSMSSGDIAISGSRAHYELRMPLYEIAHVRDPAHDLLAAIRFAGGGHEARLTASHCAAAPDTYLCTADYEFSAPVEYLDVECAFPAITVPNHVHLLRAHLNGKDDQAVFDSSFPRATIRFRPPTGFEIGVTESAAGFMRAIGGIVQVLFLAALVLAARGRKELAALFGMFAFGQIAAVLIMPHLGWQPQARFVEAAMALSLAYLAVEVLLLPAAGARWAVAGVLGVFYGLYFSLFLQNTRYNAEFVLLGALAAELAAAAVLALLFSQIRRLKAIHPVQVSAAGLLVFGMAWFLARLRG